MVVDVAVEGTEDIRPIDPAELLGVEGMGVGLRDDADARPAGVAEDGAACLGIDQCQLEQRIGADGRPQGPGVVPELTHLGGRLVDEAQLAEGRAHRHGGEHRVGGTGGEHREQLGTLQLQTVAADEQVQAGRIAAPDLEAVERRERRLDRPQCVEGRRPWGPLALTIRGRQIGDGPGRPDPVAADGPRRVLDHDGGGVDRFELARREGQVPRIQLVLDRSEQPFELLGPLGDLVGHRAPTSRQQAGHPGRPLQGAVDGEQDVSGLPQLGQCRRAESARRTLARCRGRCPELRGWGPQTGSPVRTDAGGRR